jgi:hypothetical protein
MLLLYTRINVTQPGKGRTTFQAVREMIELSRIVCSKRKFDVLMVRREETCD